MIPWATMVPREAMWSGPSLELAGLTAGLDAGSERKSGVEGDFEVCLEDLEE